MQGLENICILVSSSSQSEGNGSISLKAEVAILF